MLIKCDPRAYAKCPTRHLCGTYCDDVCFAEGSDCDMFNQEVINAPPTNADHIRSMSDEELHEFLYNYGYCDICEESCAECYYQGDCERRLADWLKQPADHFRDLTKMIEEVQDTE